jgi:hypothetical protein
VVRVLLGTQLRRVEGHAIFFWYPSYPNDAHILMYYSNGTLMSRLKQLLLFFKQPIRLGFSLEPSVYARHPSLLGRCITRVLKIIRWNNTSKKPNLSGFSDDELFSLLMQSDKDAFTAIYDRHAPTLYLHIINQICTGTTLEQAQDDTTRMLIKVFASLWHDREKPIYHNTLQEYLLSIVNRKLIDYRFFKEVFTDTLP